MGIRKYKPTTPGRRFSSVSNPVGIIRDTPEKPLLRPLYKTGGRNNNSRATFRHRGGGHKRQYCTIDFRHHDKDDVPATVAYIEYDPNHTVRVTLLYCADGERRYILASIGLEQGDQTEAGVGADIRPGNSLQLRDVLLGTIVHAIKFYPGSGARIARSAGTSVQLVAKEGRFAQLHIPPGEVRNVEATCRVVIGEAGNVEQSNINWGKAGRTRRKSKRPHARGAAMNPADHPYGGSEGRTSGGRHPVSPWDRPEGHAHRPKKTPDRMIVRRRKTGKDH